MANELPVPQNISFVPPIPDVPAVPQVPEIPQEEVELTPTSPGRGAPRKEKSGKSNNTKEALGVPEEHVISWIPFNLSPEHNAIIDAAARASDKKKVIMLRDMLLIEIARPEVWSHLVELARSVGDRPHLGKGKGAARASDQALSKEEREKKALKLLEQSQRAAKRAQELMASVIPEQLEEETEEGEDTEE